MAEHPLSPGGFSLAVLDTCALLPPRLSDVLFDLALEGLYLPHWTAEIEDEFLRNFQAVTGAVVPDGAARRLGAFRAAARMRHEIFGHMDPSAIARVPPAVEKKDVHVASAALMLARSAEAGVDKVFLVTANLEDLPPGALAIQGVVTLSPGAFVDALHAARTRDSAMRSLVTDHNPQRRSCDRQTLKIGDIDCRGAGEDAGAVPSTMTWSAAPGRATEESGKVMKSHDVSADKAVPETDGRAPSPRELMRARHPDLFSDSVVESRPVLARPVFDHHLDTLTARKEEYQFAHCR